MSQPTSSSRRFFKRDGVIVFFPKRGTHAVIFGLGADPEITGAGAALADGGRPDRFAAPPFGGADGGGVFVVKKFAEDGVEVVVVDHPVARGI